ncbi:MAG: ABC transporter substrate-binding protein [Burkholderiaceae bacterium]|jgi:peptide/nickel transport system substrate-binding protein
MTLSLRALCGLLTLFVALLAHAAEDHRGGKLRLLATSGAGTLDPQVNYTLQFAQLFVSIYDGLLTFKKAAGEASYTVVPDLAEALPIQSDGGRTYTFILRQGVRFSNGQEVTVDDVAASFQRLFKVLSPTSGTFYNLIVGADLCLKAPATCTLSKGLVIDRGRRSISFHLVKPDAEFLYKMAFGHAVIVPAASPVHDAGVQPLTGTGPYMIVSYDPKKQMRLVRNPAFRVWNAEAQPEGYVDEIDYDFGLPDEEQTSAIANGQADWMLDPVPVDRLGELGTRYPNQVKISPLAALYYLAMNNRIPPFDQPKAREAVNLAIDRSIAVRLFGGSKLAVPTCQIIPSGIGGHEDYCPWTKNPGSHWVAPDLDRAKQLVKESGTAGQKVTLIAPGSAIGRTMSSYARDVLASIGYDAQVRVLAESLQLTYVQNTSNNVQISYDEWYQDFPVASDFVDILFSCSSFHPNTDASINISGVCDPELDALMARAKDASLTSISAANAIWARVDKKIVDGAYVAPLFNPKHLDFVSKRLGNFVFSAETYFVPALAWVQ